MTIRINPALRKLWRSSDELQLGYPARTAIPEVNETTLQILSALEVGLPEQALEGYFAATGADAGAVASLLQRLQPALIKSAGIPDCEVEAKFAELMRMSLLAVDDPAALVASRRERTVFIGELNRVGITLARGLQASGVGRIISSDNRRITAADRIPLGYSGGESRGMQLSNELAQTFQLHSYLRPTTIRGIDFALVLEQEVANPESYQRWLANDVAHLSISFDEAGVAVSPLVIPGLTSCLACQTIADSELDDAYTALAAQISLRPRDLADSASLLFAAGIAIHRTLGYLDATSGLRAPSETTGLRLNNDGSVSRVHYANRNCGCALSG